MPNLKQLTLAFGENEDFDEDEEDNGDGDDEYSKHKEFCQKISAKKNIKVEIESNPGWD